MEKNERFVEGTSFWIKNVTLFYAQVFEHNPDDYEGKIRWKITAVLEPELADKMLNAGFDVRQDDEGNRLLVCYRNKDLKNKKVNDPPVVKGPDGKIMDGSVLIGNGSVGDLLVWAKYVTVKKETFLPPYLNEVRVTELIPYGDVAESADDIL